MQGVETQVSVLVYQALLREGKTQNVAGLPLSWDLAAIHCPQEPVKADQAPPEPSAGARPVPTCLAPSGRQHRSPGPSWATDFSTGDYIPAPGPTVKSALTQVPRDFSLLDSDS